MKSWGLLHVDGNGEWFEMEETATNHANLLIQYLKIPLPI